MDASLAVLGSGVPGQPPRQRSSAMPPANGAVWACAFVLLELACQLGLMIDTLGSLRALMRSAAFLTSVAFLIFLPGTGKEHPVRPWLMGALAIVWLNILHPTTNSLLAGIAHATLYLAVLAPFFWAGRLALDESGLRRVLLLMWAFHSLSAGVGVLQMHYPGRFQPRVSAAIENMGQMADAYKMRLANGEMTWRPMGLTDTPGGAASSGMFAVIFGLGFFLRATALALKALSVAGLAVGSFCLYISQVRSLLVMAALSCLALLGILIRRGEVQRLMGVTLVLPLIVVATFFWASSIGGEATVDRLSTLIQDDFGTVYSKNRGHFLTHTFTVLLPDYPLGAGLGRWGMMRGYFGDDANANSPAIWVEIQWTAWLLDGGVPLLAVYVVAVLLTSWLSLRIALNVQRGEFALWAAVICALNLGFFALTFNYPVFIGQGGMEFWFLNGCLIAAARRVQAPARRRRTARTRPKSPGSIVPGAPLANVAGNAGGDKDHGSQRDAGKESTEGTL